MENKETVIAVNVPGLLPIIKKTTIKSENHQKRSKIPSENMLHLKIGAGFLVKSCLQTEKK